MNIKYRVVVASLLALWLTPAAFAQANAVQELTRELFASGYPTIPAAQQLKDQLLFQSAVQTYLWALPALTERGL